MTPTLITKRGTPATLSKSGGPVETYRTKEVATGVESTRSPGQRYERRTSTAAYARFTFPKPAPSVPSAPRVLGMTSYALNISAHNIGAQDRLPKVVVLMS